MEIESSSMRGMLESLFVSLIQACPSKEEEIRRIESEYRSDSKSMDRTEAQKLMKERLVDLCGILHLASALRQAFPFLVPERIQSLSTRARDVDHALFCDEEECDHSNCKAIRSVKKRADSHVVCNFLPFNHRLRVSCSPQCKPCIVSMTLSRRENQLKGTNHHRTSLIESVKRDKSSEKIPTCPITLETIVDPSRIAICDHVFESSSLDALLSKGVSRCPICRTPFSSRFVEKDYEVSKLISEQEVEKKIGNQETRPSKRRRRGGRPN